jgi:PAS domain S-box-containing protein
VDADRRVVICDRRFSELLGSSPHQAGGPLTDSGRRGRAGRAGAERRSANGRCLVAAPGSEAPRVVEAGGRRVHLRSWRLPDGGFVQVCTAGNALPTAAGPLENSAADPTGAGLLQGLCEDAGRTIPEWDPQRRFWDHADAGSDWLWETDAGLAFSCLTDQFTALTGIAIEHLIGRIPTELAADGGLESAELRRHEADLEARRPLRDLCCPLADPATGGIRHIRISGKPVFDRAGRFLGYRGTGADVTAEVEATRNAVRAEIRLRDAIESINDGFALFDEHDRLVICNRRFCEIDGLGAELAVPGTSWEAILRGGIERGHYADAHRRVGAYLAERLEHHRRADGSVLEHRLADGRWIRIGAYRTSDGGTVATRTDITEMRRRESARVELGDELRTQCLRFNAALNNMIQGLCMFDADQRLIVCNERYLQMYGFSPEVVKPGIGLREIMEYSVSLGNYRREDAERAIAERPTTADKRERAVLHQRLNDGRVIAVMHQPMADGGSVATYEDVTQAVRAEEALRGYARKLERSNRELQDFASIASHDLQEPLRKIEAFGDRLKARCADDLSEAGRIYIDRMQEAARRMRSLINDLLTYSRVTTKARPFVPVDLDRIATEVMSDLQVTIEQADARIELGDLPVVDADPTQMRQLLQNLLSNALKFRRPGVPPVVRIAGRVCETDRGAGAASTLCEVTVVDNGIGFKPDYARRIFGIFQRLHGRGDYPGTGIGLATCRKILERHGGTIAASSQPGEGATFVFTLPMHQTSEPVL